MHALHAALLHVAAQIRKGWHGPYVPMSNRVRHRHDRCASTWVVVVAQRLATQHAAVHGLCSVCSGSAPVLALEGTLTLELIRLYTEPRGRVCFWTGTCMCAFFTFCILERLDFGLI